MHLDFEGKIGWEKLRIIYRVHIRIDQLFVTMVNLVLNTVILFPPFKIDHVGNKCKNNCINLYCYADECCYVNEATFCFSYWREHHGYLGQQK